MAEVFSDKLKHWLETKQPKTFGNLEEVFQEKSFAVAFLILMLPAALPLPTGGITHVFAAITMLLALELIFGRKTIWVPSFLKRRNLGKSLEKKALPKLVSFIKWFEKRSKKRLLVALKNQQFLRLVGLIVFIFALASIAAVPFTGLDTLPALAVVTISLSLILEDALLLVYAIGIGLVGIALEVSLGSAALHFLHRF